MGEYRLLLRVLRLNGDAALQKDYDMYVSQEMGSYYRDPNLTWQLDERYNPAVALANPDKQHAESQPDSDQAQPTGPTRYCSVRGCTSILPQGYGNKMCDTCRGRHRIYASTKRAKRKMEKAALGMVDGTVQSL